MADHSRAGDRLRADPTLVPAYLEEVLRFESPFRGHFRVATRRARAMLRLFGPFFKPRALAGFQRDLRRTARALGAVRDLDVALAKLAKFSRDQDEPVREALAELAAEWRVERRHAYRELVAWLDSSAYRRFIAEFDAFLHRPGQGARRFASARARTTPPTSGDTTITFSSFCRAMSDSRIGAA